MSDPHDSGYEDNDNLSTETLSVTSSITEPLIRHGREYHSFHPGEYSFPKDEDAKAQLDFQHAIFMETFNQELSFAPVAANALKVLDLGTGTGIWAVEYAYLNSQALVHGIDLGALQPTNVPPNYYFFLQDFEDQWPSDLYNYVFGRNLFGSIHDFEKLQDEIWDHLQPRGWVEFQDIGPLIFEDSSLRDTALQQWMNLIVESLKHRGVNPDLAKCYDRYLDAKGFVKVTQHSFIWPLNPWPRDQHLKALGRLCREYMLDALHSLSVELLTEMHVPNLEAFLARVRQDIQNKKIHAYWPVYITFAQKPA